MTAVHPAAAGGAVLFGSVCSGIEAASVAFGPLGWQAAWLAETAPFPRAVLAHHYPGVPNLGDMATIARRVLTGEAPAPDVLCGGTPCQAFSVAGLRRSLQDARGNLTLKFVELANAIDHVRARSGAAECIVFWENVPGVLSTKDNAFGCFLAGLAGEDEPLQPPGKKWANAGAVYGPRRAIAWRTLDAQYFGLAQRRRRVFVVASARKGFDPAQVLFEWDGLRRDTPPRRETGQAAPTVPARSTAGGGLGTDCDCDGGLIHAYGGNNQRGSIDVATARNACASASGRMDFETETFLVQPAHTLRGDGFDASEDGTGRGTPLVPIHFQTRGSNLDLGQNVTGTLDTSAGQASGSAPCIAFPAFLSGTQHASTENLSPALGALNPTAVAVALRGREGGATAELGGEVQHALRASSGGGDKPHVMAAMRVRRITPTEAERLQGFPDGYTRIPGWLGWRDLDEGENPDDLRADGLQVRQSPKTGKWRVNDPDGPRYKALGNSWAIHAVRWIGARIHQHILKGYAA